MPKTAFVTGVTGQDGYYLATYLMDVHGYRVHGLVRRVTSGRASGRLERLRTRPEFVEHVGDMTDGQGLARIIRQVLPNEIYNLAAQSHVGDSFHVPEATFHVNCAGLMHILETLRSDPYLRDIKVYQAGTSEMFGRSPPPQTIDTPFDPRSPYAIAKVAAHHLVKLYRDAYGLYAVNGILFNHESPERDPTFVTQKIATGLARVAAGMQKQIALGNVDAKRDWGHAADYVRAMHAMLQQPVPMDYVVATGETRSVKEFVDAVASKLGMRLEWLGPKGQQDAYNVDTGECIVRHDPELLRPAEVPLLQGDPGDAPRRLGWAPHKSFDDLVEDMLRSAQESLA